jgi:predicted transcriptional regulator
MTKTTCEKIRWNILPFIRKELSCSIIQKHGLSQKEAAVKLGLTPAALSQYKCNKRAKCDSEDLTIFNEIDISASKIVKNGTEVVESEICRLCRIIQSKGVNIIK